MCKHGFSGKKKMVPHSKQLLTEKSMTMREGGQTRQKKCSLNFFISVFKVVLD